MGGLFLFSREDCATRIGAALAVSVADRRPGPVRRWRRIADRRPCVGAVADRRRRAMAVAMRPIVGGRWRRWRWDVVARRRHVVDGWGRHRPGDRRERHPQVYALRL